MGLIIAGCRSGEGKTTVTLAILAYLTRQGATVQSFKVGPDYIDPMFHSLVSDRPCRNLDPVLTSCDYVQNCFTYHSCDVDYALIEGVMGLFDGISYNKITDFASTAHIARLLDLPVLLVIDCSRLSGSIAAIAHGYRSFDSRIKLAGVILNRVGSDRHLELLTNALQPLNLPILGVLRREDSVTFPSRHLGLVIPSEIPQFTEISNKLTAIGQSCFDWSQLLPLMSVKSKTSPQSLFPSIPWKQRQRLAIARDQAFNFYYQDNLDILTANGVKLIPWSPLKEEKLPPDIQGIYLGGGYPEVFASQLAENQAGKNALKQAIQQGLPTYAECGGLMYLSEEIIDFNQNHWSMVGILPTTAIMTQKLTLGYRQAQGIITDFKDDQVWGHQFHRSQLTTSPRQPVWRINHTYEGWRINKVYASYLHLHFGGYPHIVQEFLITK
ncbi:MAG: cobyrinate a,c-diamide synthase [Gloeocapsa sp. DLM2.Bin57]|nr:MAG: cobyrinate a,c-diamide synthase [Gloeocapsa sp. DLM2.Bin57]